MINYREVLLFCIYSVFIVNSIYLGAIGGSKTDEFLSIFL